MHGPFSTVHDRERDRHSDCDIKTEKDDDGYRQCSKRVDDLLQRWQQDALRGAETIAGPVDAMRKMQLILDKPYLAIEMDGSVVVISTANINYFQFSPKPEVIPEFFLRGVEMIEA
jgi:hypothetical protein